MNDIIVYDDLLNKENLRTRVLYDNLPKKYHKDFEKFLEQWLNKN